MSRVLLAVATLVVALGTVFALSELATHRGGRTVHTTPKFLTSALGAPRPAASLVRTPAPNVSIAIHPRGFTFDAGAGGVLTLTNTEPAAAATRFANGTVARTDYGSQAITIDNAKAAVESFSTVGRRLGLHTWRWRLDTPLAGRVSELGWVGFFDRKSNKLESVSIAPVQILDNSGRDVTPQGAHWELATKGKQQYLTLTLDDAKLPVPYTIDPAVFRTVATTSSAAASGTFTVTEPATVNAKDLLLIQETGKSTTATATVPAVPTDASGGNAWASITGTNVANGTVDQFVFWKWAVAADPSKVVTVTIPASTTETVTSASIEVYRGLDSTQAAPQQTGVTVTRTNTTFRTPAITATGGTNQEHLFVLVGANFATSTTWPANVNATGGTWTRQVNIAGTAATEAQSVYDFDTAANTVMALTTSAATFGASTNNVSAAFGFRDDVTAPTNSITLTNVTGNAYLAGSPVTGAAGTVYYNTSAAGSFQIQNAVSDSGSGPASSTFPALVGGTNWSHTAPATQTTPVGGPYNSGASPNNFSWLTTSSGSPTETIVGSDNTSGPLTATTTLTFVNDTAGPNAFALTAPAGGATIANGQALTSSPTDALSGVASVAYRYCAGFTCTWATGTAIGSSGSPYTVNWNSQPTNGTYTIIGRATDNVGNTTDSSTVTVTVNNAVAGSPSVDATTQITASAATGLTLSWTQAVGSQPNKILLVTASMEASAACSTVSVSYGATAMTKIKDTTTTTGQNGGNYDCVSMWYLVNPTGPSATVTATMTTTGTTVALSGGGVVIYNVKQAGPDASNSGLNETGIASVTLSTTTANSLVIDAYSSGNGVGNLAPTAPQSVIWTVDGATTESAGMSSKAVAAVGPTTNTWTHSTPAVENRSVIVAAAFSTDTTPPTSALSFNEATNPGGQFELSTGAHAWTYYYNPVATGTFTMTDAASDASGVASTDFPALSTTGFTGTAFTDTTNPYTSNTYTFDNTNVAAPSAATATVWDTFGNFTNETVTFVRDVTAPTGGAFTANGTAATGVGSSSYLNSGTSLTINSRTDFAETQNGTASGLGSSVLTMQTGTLSGNSCSAYGAPATIVGTTAQTVASGHCYLFILTGTDNVGNVAPTLSTTVMVDTTAPSAPTFTFANLGGGAYYSGAGTTVWFRPAAATGTFDITASSTDADTGITSYTFPSAATMGTNWAVSGAGATRTYSYTAGAGTPGAQNVTATNPAGLTSAGGSWTTSADSTAPGSGAFSANGTAATGGGSSSYLNSGTTLTINSRTDYTDGGSGLASSTLTMATGTLSGNSCSAYGAPATIVGTTAQTVASGHCYLLTLTGTDNVGNTATISTTVKVDTTAPSAPTFTFANLGGGAYYSGAGTTVWFRPAAATGTFDITGSSTDADTGIASYTFPTAGSMGANWAVSGAGATRTYSYTSGAVTPGAQTATATNNAGLTSGTGSWTTSADSTAPGSGAFTANGTVATGGGSSSYLNSGTTLTINSRTDYTDGGSGLASSTLTMATGTLSGNSCSAYGAPATIVGTTAQTVASGHCYLLTLAGTDNVGNTASITTTVMVDTTAPSAPTGFAFSGLTSSYYPGAGSIVYLKAGAAGGFTVTASGSTDADTGVASYSYGAIAGSGWSNALGAYTFTGASPTGTGAVTATNNAGLTGSSASFTAQSDATAPAGGAVTANGTAASGAGTTSYINSGTTLTINSRTDYTETQTATASGLASSTLTMATGTLSANTCSAYGAPATIVGTTAQTVASGHCYLLTLTGTDNVGNAASISTVVMVDTSAPSAPTGFAFSALTDSFYPGAGTTSTSRAAAPAASPQPLPEAPTPSRGSPATTTARSRDPAGRTRPAPTPSPPPRRPARRRSPRRTTPGSRARRRTSPRSPTRPHPQAAPSQSTAPQPAAPAPRATSPRGQLHHQQPDRLQDADGPAPASPPPPSRRLRHADRQQLQQLRRTRDHRRQPRPNPPAACYLHTLTGLDNVGNAPPSPRPSRWTPPRPPRRRRSRSAH